MKCSYELLNTKRDFFMITSIYFLHNRSWGAESWNKLKEKFVFKEKITTLSTSRSKLQWKVVVGRETFYFYIFSWHWSVSISSKFYKQLLRMQIPKAQIRQSSCQSFLRFWDLCVQKLLIECWWNWPLVSFD